MDRNSFQRSKLSIAVALSLFGLVGGNLSAFAQGIGEMGSVYAAPKGGPNMGVVNGVNNVYGKAADTINGNGAGLPANLPMTEDGEVDMKALYKMSGKQANILYQYAAAKEKAGKLVDAQRGYYKCLLIRQRLWGDRDPGTQSLIYKLGDINLRMGKYQYAETCFKRFLGILAKQHGPGNYESVPALIKLGELYTKQKQYSDAASVDAQVLGLEERKLGEEHPECVKARLNLIDATIANKDFHEAENYLRQSMVLENKKGNPKSPAYLHMLNSYAEVMTALNRPSDAAEYQSKAATLKAELDAAAPVKPEEKPAQVGASSGGAAPAKEAAPPAPQAKAPEAPSTPAPAAAAPAKSEGSKDLSPAPTEPAKPAPDAKK